jgi:hypothetical protein
LAAPLSSQPLARKSKKSMTNDYFAAWAAERGLAHDTIEQLMQLAATPEEMKEAFDEMEPSPPIYTLQDIQEMTDGDPYGISPVKHGFMIIGGCPNGDPVAIDIRDNIGSVWYIGHESMHSTPLRSIAIRVADDPTQFIEGICHEDTFPIDFYEAKQQQNTN